MREKWIDPTKDRPRRIQAHRIIRDQNGNEIGYEVLHPTKGWKRVSASRLAAIKAMNLLMRRLSDTARFVNADAPPRKLPFSPKINRHTGFRHSHVREIARRTTKPGSEARKIMENRNV